jgi:phage terminase small subunit
MKLTPKENRFVQEYITNGYNATAAYKAAGYKYGADSTARAAACDLTAKPSVKAAIEAHEKEIGNKYNIRVGELVNELKAIAFGNLADIVEIKTVDNEEYGAQQQFIVIKSTEEMTGDQRRTLAEISETTQKGQRTIKIKQHDKIAAIKELLKISGALTEKIDITSGGEKLMVWQIISASEATKEK